MQEVDIRVCEVCVSSIIIFQATYSLFVKKPLEEFYIMGLCDEENISLTYSINQ